MGYQNMNDNSQQTYNEGQARSSNQKTSTVSKKAQDTTHCQYERLSTTKTIKGTTGE